MSNGELINTYRKLQNGSDIRGIALEGVSGEVPNLTEREASLLSAGYIYWLSGKTGLPAEKLTVAVGRDPRLSGEALKTAVVMTMEGLGVKVLDAGLASTPAMFMSTLFPNFNCDGAMMITASHLPWNRNGFKYFYKKGGLDKGDITAIIDWAFANHESALLKGGSGTPCDLMDQYATHLRELIVRGANMGDLPLAGLKIVVDAGNGAGGFYAADVLSPLGADVSASQFLEPDGKFPNHMPNPEDKQAMDSISKRVVDSQADFGIIFDTDVDRASAVDHLGREISRNGIVAMAAALVAENYPGTTVVTDSITSDQLHEFLEGTLGLKHLRFKRGYKNVINEAVRLNENGIDSQLAIETSGHAALKENYFLDDGAYLATKIVIKAAQLHQAGKKLASIIEDLEEPLEATEVRLPINCDDFAPYGDRLLEDLKVWVEDNKSSGVSLVIPNYEGVRVRFDKENGDGWFLIRKSLHDPILPLNIESNIQGGIHIIADMLRPFLSNYKCVDISRL